MFVRHYSPAILLLILFLTFFSTVFAQSTFVIDSIEIKGNELTKRNIILRELMFQQKDTVPFSNWSVLSTKSRENLLNASLFNFVTIDTLPNQLFHYTILVTLIERWYIWPFPILELADRNFNVWWKTKDFSRLNYGVYVVKDNFRGRRETLKFKFQLGYNEEMAFSYTIPYVNKKQTLGLGIVAGYSRNHETNYATNNNIQQFYKDEIGYTRKKHSEGIRITYRKNLRSLHFMELKYNFASVADTIVKLNPDYFLPNQSSIQYFSAFYKYEFDQRNSKYYPMLGYYLAFEFMKNGFGLIGDNHLSADFMMLSGKYFLKIKPRWYAAAGFKTKLSVPGKPAYALQRGLGYADFVRGYEYYVIDGQHFTLLKSELRFLLVPTQVTKIPFIKSEKFNKIHYTFYLNAYSDIGYVWDQYYYANNSLVNTFLLGSGISLNYVTYYDKVLGLNLSINKMSEIGLFLHYLAPI